MKYDVYESLQISDWLFIERSNWISILLKIIRRDLFEMMSELKHMIYNFLFLFLDKFLSNSLDTLIVGFLPLTSTNLVSMASSNCKHHMVNSDIISFIIVIIIIFLFWYNAIVYLVIIMQDCIYFDVKSIKE